MIILGEIFSLLAALCLAYSTFSNKKNKMMLWQAINSVFYGLSNLFLGAYSAVVTNILSLFRNTLQVKNKLSRNLTIIICLLMTVVGLIFNNMGWIGLLPIVASVSYTICVYVLKSAQQMRIALVINLLQWMVVDFIVKSYPMFVMDIIIISVTLVNVVRYKKGSSGAAR